MNKYKIIALIGEAGSGKDTILKKLTNSNLAFHEIVSCTTRPPREGEVNGDNYYFISPEEFGCKILANEMLEAAVFNDWCYGTSFDSLRINDINIGVFNPTGIETMNSLKNVDLTVYYVRASDKTRLKRQLDREENPDIDEIIRRYHTDKEDFYDLDFDYIELINEKPGDIDVCVRTIMDNLTTTNCI